MTCDPLTVCSLLVAGDTAALLGGVLREFRAYVLNTMDIDLLISADDSRAFNVTVVNSPADGGRCGPLRLNLEDQEFQRSLQMLEDVRGVSWRSLHQDRPTWQAEPYSMPSNELQAARIVGTALFEALFSSELHSLYRSSLALAREQGKRLRLRLRVEAPKLAVLPWEFLYDETEGDHVTLLRDTPLARYLELDRPIESLIVQPPIRILGMVASPNDLTALDTGGERRSMVAAIDHLIEARHVELAWVEGQSWRDLNRMMQTGSWHIFHFIGHGYFNIDSGEGNVALVDETNGKAK